MTTASRPNLLYLTHRVPYPPDKGDRIRCFHVLEYLRRRANVHLACLADEPVDPCITEELTRRCERLVVVPLGGAVRWGRALWSLVAGGTASEGAFASPQLSRAVDQLVHETRYSAALTSNSSLAPYLRHPGLRDATRVIDLIDVDSQKWLDYARGSWHPRAWLHWLEGKRLRRLERRLTAESRALLLTTDAEVRLFRQFCDTGDVRAAACGVDLDYFAPDAVPGEQEREASCVFVGALDYRPNVDAAVWFCHEVWPRLRKDCPEARFWLVGRRPTPEVQELAKVEGVEVVGQVADVRPYVARAAVTVVPLRIARGIQNKVIESLAMGKATVVSPQTLGGLRTEPGVHLAVASTSDEWTATVLELFRDREKRRQLGSAGRRHTEEHHRWERCLAPFAELLGLPAEPVGPQ
jgi:sugar transferase (PEP-CTERM/EpsH1 system associated)